MSILGDLVAFARSVPYPGKIALRLILKPDLGARAQRVAREAQDVADRGELTQAESDRLGRDFKRAVLADVLELAGVPDAMGLGATQLASVIIPGTGRVDHETLTRAVNEAPRPWTLANEARQITGDPLLS